MDKILILGGSGFIGSNLAKRFVDEGYEVSVIDGLLNKTGGRKENLEPIISNITFINSRIEDVDKLDKIVEQSDFIIDCMAWTAHKSAISNPKFDLRLNVESHLALIDALKRNPNKRIILLGTRAQYGNPPVDEINEETPMIPEDIQGIHKLTSESYFRVYSKIMGLNVVCLRLPNCFGENQITQGDDIGLIGGFIRDILDDKCIEVFDGSRKRYLLYVEDLAEIILKLSQKRFEGFSAFNVGGVEVGIEELVKTIIKILGRGSYEKKSIPFEIKSIDTGSAKFNDFKLKSFIGETHLRDFEQSLKKTIRYFQENLK